MNCRSTVEAASDNEQLVSFIPPAMYRVPMSIHTRSEVEATSPHLLELLTHALKHLDESVPENRSAVGVLVEVEFLTELLQPFCDARGITRRHVADEVVALMLPPEFEADLANFASNICGVFNHPTLSLAENRTYFGWQGRISDLDNSGRALPAAVWVGAHELSGALGPSSKEELDERPQWGWSPVVFVAGNTVVVGGFPVDVFEVGAFQAATVSAQGYMREDVYSDEEIEAAKQLAESDGDTPWYEQPYLVDGKHVLAVQIFRATRTEVGTS